MKILEKISLILFSLIISVLSIVIILLIFNVIQIGFITKIIYFVLNDEVLIKVFLGIAIVALLLAIKCIFFGDDSEEAIKSGVILENSAGKLVISKESLENLIGNVVKDVAGIEVLSSRTFLDKDNNLIVYVTTLVSRDSVIKEVSAEIQEKIKDALTKTADLQVKQVNIKIKNITNKKIKGLPAGETVISDEKNNIEENNN